MLIFRILKLYQKYTLKWRRLFSHQNYNKTACQNDVEVIVVSTLNFNVILILIKWHCFQFEMQLFLQHKHYNFLSIINVFMFNSKSQRFNVELMLIQRWQTDFVSTFKYSYLFNVTVKILIFQASRCKNKIVFGVNPKSKLFQH